MAFAVGLTFPIGDLTFLIDVLTFLIDGQMLPHLVVPA